MEHRDAGRPRPYWAVPALIALLLAPAPWAYVMLAAALAGAGALRAAGRAADRRAKPRALPRMGDSIRLGAEMSGRAVVLSEPQLSAHGLILGASGAGKTTTLLRILSEHIRRDRPVIAIDMKGSPEFIRRLAAAATAAGRPLRLWTPDGPDHWNPLQHGNATELKDKLIATERFTEPHYQRAAERYVQSVLQVLHTTHPGAPATLNEVVNLMDPPRLAAVLRRLPRDRAERLQDYLASMTPDQLSAVRGLGTRLAIISESHTGPQLEPAGGDTIDLRAALRGEEVVVFSLNSSTYGKLSAQIGTLAIQDLISAAGHRLATPGEQAIIGIDEFSALGADNLISLLARGRESGMSVMLATQELADLDRAARGLRDQVLGVTAIKIVHRQDVPASTQTVAQMAGTEQVWERTYQLGRGPLGGHSTSRGTRRQVERFVVHPNEIRTLPTGQAVLITKIPTASARVVRVDPPRQLPAPTVAGFDANAPRPSGSDRAAQSIHSPRAGRRGAAPRSGSRTGPAEKRPGPELG
jgi:conjugal transfer pilus assembly protein TraD